MAKDFNIVDVVTTDIAKASNRDEALRKLISAWNSKNAKVAKRAGTFGFMAAALAACGGGGDSGSASADKSTFFVIGSTNDGFVKTALNLTTFQAAIASAKAEGDNDGLIDVANFVKGAEQETLTVTDGVIPPESKGLHK